MRINKILLLILFITFSVSINSQEYTAGISSTKLDEIDSFIVKNQKKWKTPGLSIVIINNNETIFRNFGYSDIENSIEVNKHTLFEIGSNSKAFTGLGLLLLVEEGQISLQDPVSKYLPWLHFLYDNEVVDVKIEDFLYHKSGIPFDSIIHIPIDNKPGAIENTVRTLVDSELDFAPGSHFSYATINYDVLGLIIEKVSGMTFEDYISKEVFIPLGLINTYSNMDNAQNTGNMAAGYKMNFLVPREYDAPYYRGSVPAGYIVSCSSDISRWLQIQLGLIDVPQKYRDAIDKSHEADLTVRSSMDGSFYGAGWSVVYESNGFISHGGSNPNFSSYIRFSQKDQMGVAILGNMNSESTEYIGNGIIDILNNVEPEKMTRDLYTVIDRASVVMLLASSILFVATIIFLIHIIIGIIRKEREKVKMGGNLVLNIIGTISFFFTFGYCLYKLPTIFFGGLDWNSAQIWGSSLFFPAIIILSSLVILFTFYVQILFYFRKEDEKAIYPLVLLSLISGIGNALVISIINAALFGSNEMRIQLLVYFFLGIFIYIVCQKVVRSKMAVITNHMIYKKRMFIVNSLLKTPFYKYESIKDGHIQATLNNDTQQVANAPNLIVGSLTSLTTVLCCFIYLGTINFQGLLVAIVIIFIAAFSYFIVGSSSEKLWERTRDIQNIFFNFIDSLINGFKELTLNKYRNREFREDMNSCCEETRDKEIEATIKFANVFVLGELLFTIVIGIVGFLFPFLFPQIPNKTLLTFVFVFLYMNGPINILLNMVPQALQLKIAWKRINNFINEIKIGNKDIKSESVIISSESVELTLENVKFSYKSELEKFSVGPFNHKFKSGEITFITGGNGSGKTTLAKLITGLYKPEEGSICINGNEVNSSDLNNLYSTVFSDYYLFKKLYGIDHSKKNMDIDRILKNLQIDEKVTLKDGIFSSIDLSTGQKKRLALLVSYLEDRPIFLFDEWAADQDPEFRKYFYHKILPELKTLGKCVIAITHDDHYFDTADKIIKLDMGLVDSIEENESAM